MKRDWGTLKQLLVSSRVWKLIAVAGVIGIVAIAPPPPNITNSECTK